MLEITLAILAIVAPASLSVLFRRARQANRKKLINVVYYHAKFTQENLQKWEEPILNLPDKMREEPCYTPFFVVPDEDNLAYSNIIELMQWLKGEVEEEIVLRYFHAQANLHATAASFGTEVVRNLPLERKIELANRLAQFCGETLEYAEKVEELLEKKRR